MLAPMSEAIRGQDRPAIQGSPKRPLSLAGLQLDVDSIHDLRATFEDRGFAGSILPALAETIRKRNSITTEQLLVKLLPMAQELAYPTINQIA